MTVSVVLAYAILGVTVALFVSDKLRLDVVALISLLAVAVFGLVPVDVALSGFANPAVVMIAGLFVVGAALTDTGVADWLGRRLERLAGDNEARMLVAVVSTTALLSAFMSSTGTVAILLPVVGTLARRRGIAPAKLFMPLAFAAHLGSNLTLISTPPNILVSDTLREAGRIPFRFFSFLGPGVAVLVVGVGYLLLLGRRLLARVGIGKVAPRASSLTLSDLAAEYGLHQSLTALRIPAHSKLVGSSLGDSELRARFGVTVVALLRPVRRGLEALRVVPRVIFAEYDHLRVLGAPDRVAAAMNELAIDAAEEASSFVLPPEESLVEVVVPRRSRLAGHTLHEAKFRDRYRATALAVRRRDGKVQTVHTALSLRDLKLSVGDTLLLKGRARYLRNLRDERSDLIVVAEPDAGNDSVEDPLRAWLSVGLTLLMLVVMAFGWLPNVIAVLLAALTLVLLRCVRPADVYRAVNWESVVLIAGMIPLAAALEHTGATTLLVSALERVLAGAHPWTVMALLLGVTSAVGMVLSNTATAVLLAPLALRLAGALGLSPEPLLMGVAFASSAAFATPIASPVNVLVMGPGGYRFADFVKVGLPLQLLVLLAAMVTIPLVFPF